MKIHEYQAKQLFSKAGIPVPEGRMAETASEADCICDELGYPVVIKAQVHVGGRGKAGGVKVADDQESAGTHISNILHMNLKGLQVERILVEKAQPIESECYLGIVLDRGRGRIVIMASREGGVEIEEVARKSPELITKITLDPERGLLDFQAEHIARKLFGSTAQIPADSSGGAAQGSTTSRGFDTTCAGTDAVQTTREIVKKLYSLFVETDADLAEINPLIRTKDGRIMALDGKMSFDDNALYRHQDIESMRITTADEETELYARSRGLSYIALDRGDIGCMVNGAGLAMTTMDVIKRCGGEPANFLDIGGSSNPQKVVDAFRLLTADSRVKAIFVNIFGGITRCDDVARGMVEAISELQIQLPIVVRLTGTNDTEGRRILANSPLIPAESLAEGAQKTVEAARNRKEG